MERKTQIEKEHTGMTCIYSGWIGLWFMVFNATFNNISARSWWIVLLVEETGVTGENQRPAVSP